MKKIYIAIPLAAMMLASCDPSEIDLGSPSAAYSESALSEGFSFVQYSDEAHTQQATDGNYFTYATNPNEPVQIVTVNADGEETIIGNGSTGSFKIVPKRGESSDVQFFVRLKNQDGSVTQVEKSANVYVPAELNPEMRYLVSDAYGEKIWTWDTEFRADEGCWGNIGYAGCSGEEFAATGGCIWWGGKPENLADADQRKNAGDDPICGEENRNAYMTFDWKNSTISTYDAAGKKIRGGKFAITNWKNGKRSISSIDGGQPAWALGTLETDPGAILFPYKINGGGEKPKSFEILQLDGNHLKLVYVAPGTGAWAEATWWAFKKK